MPRIAPRIRPPRRIVEELDGLIDRIVIDQHMDQAEPRDRFQFRLGHTIDDPLQLGPRGLEIACFEMHLRGNHGGKGCERRAGKLIEDRTGGVAHFLGVLLACGFLQGIVKARRLRGL